MEATIETNHNDEINMLRIKLDVVEKELQIAISRAEIAECEIERLQNLYKKPCHTVSKSVAQSTPTDSPTTVCSHCGNAFQSSSSASELVTIAPLLPKPPPPPTPMPNFKPNPVHLVRCCGSLKDGITSFTLNNPRETADNVSLSSDADTKKSATGRFTY